MIFYYLDASAWVKRYYRETGTDWIQNLFAQNPTVACATLGVVEVIATLARKRKAVEINLELFEQKAQELDDDWSRFVQVQLTTEVVDLARQSAHALALRGADAIHLASANLLKGRLGENDQLILVASDDELLNAAQSSGLAVLDPNKPETRFPGSVRAQNK